LIKKERKMILHNVQSKWPSMGRSNNAKNERPQTRHFDAKKSNAVWSRTSAPSRTEHRATEKGSSPTIWWRVAEYSRKNYATTHG
jgi:hypothetical protein